jgi:hypothetical protein
LDDTIDFDLTMPVPCEDGQEKIKEDCKKIADLFEASSTSLFETQDGLIFHLEFDGVEKFARFAEYLSAHGLLRLDAVHTKSSRVH